MPAFALTPAPDGGYAGQNTAEGTDALFSLTSGTDNTAIGFNALYRNTIGSDNTATGDFALEYNTTGKSNTASGSYAMESNTTGIQNTGNGAAALGFNSTGNYNTASGAFALQYNRSGLQNTATGAEALMNNGSSNNAATGYRALFSNTTGQSNTAMGTQSLLFNSTGSDNTGTGINALYSNTSGNRNTASGVNTLLSNTTGYFNTADGGYALSENIIGHDNTAEGFQALWHNTGSFNVALGSNAGANLTNGSNNIDIGNKGVAGESGKIRIGAKGAHNGTFVAGISGVAVSGAQVIVSSTGKLGVAGSSARFKEQIKPMDDASEAILKLKPVTFRYKGEIDPAAIPQFGLVAENVEKVSPDLVDRDDKGNVMTVRYDAVNAMLLNEFLKEHRKVEELMSIVATQNAVNTRQQKQIEALTAGLRKVSAQVQLTKSLPQAVANISR